MHTTVPQSRSALRPARLRKRRRVCFRNRYIVERFEQRMLMSLTIAGEFTSSNHYTLNLYSDDSAVASSGTIAISWGDGTGDIVYGTGDLVSHFYPDTDPHIIVAYAADSLDIAADDTFVFNDTGHSVMIFNTLTMGTDATLDITDHDLVLGHASLAAVNQAILKGFGISGAGDITITSSTAVTNDGFLASLDSGGLELTNWQNTGLPGDDLVIIKNAILGDANLDGTVDGFDIVAVQGNYGATTSGFSNIGLTWLTGDVNFDGLVDGFDVVSLQGYWHWGTSQAGTFLLAEAYGEPGDLVPGEALYISNAIHVNEANVTGISGPIVATTGNLIYTLTFNKSVTGVDASDFALKTTGSISGYTVVSVAGSASSYTVTVNPGSGWGTLRLDLNDDDSIHDANGNKLGGTGEGNGNFYGSEFVPKLTVGGSTNGTEGGMISLSVGASVYTAPTGSTWEIDWGDGNTETQTGSTYTFGHAYEEGSGQYFVSVNLVDEDGNYLSSDIIPVSVVPAQPQNFQAVDNQDGSAMLTWGTSSGLSIWSVVEISENGGNYEPYAEVNAPASGSFLVEGLTAGETYSFRLTAYNLAGNSMYAVDDITTSPVVYGSLNPQDDSPSLETPLGFEINFYGKRYSSVWINNNGNVTFGAAHGEYSPIPSMSASSYAMIAPFFSDVDTRAVDNATGGTVSWAAETYNDPSTHINFTSLVVHWTGVDYFNRTASEHTAQSNTFSLHLVRREDTGEGNFDIVFDYGDLNWDTGDASGGMGGHADTNSTYHPARAGYTNGSGLTGTYAELTNSGTIDGLLPLANSVAAYQIRMPEIVLGVSDNTFVMGRTDNGSTPIVDFMRVLEGEDGLGHVTVAFNKVSGVTLPFTIQVFNSSTNAMVSSQATTGSYSTSLNLADGKYVARVVINGFTVREIPFFVAAIETSIFQVASDQFDGNRQNAISLSHDSILIGNRADDYGYVAVVYQLRYQDPVRNVLVGLEASERPVWHKIFVQISGNGSHRTTATYDTSLTGQPTFRESVIRFASVTGLDKWNVGIGIDANNNGDISNAEVKSIYGDTASRYITQVNKAKYDDAYNSARTTAWLGIVKPFASENLFAFLDNHSNPFSDAQGRLAVEPASAAFTTRWGKLDEVVGWNPAQGWIPLNIYYSDNPFTQALVADTTFRSQINKLILDPHKAAMAGSGNRTYTWSVSSMSIDLDNGATTVLTDSDMHLAIGKFNFSGTVAVNFLNNTVTSIEFLALGNDLYDWDFNTFGGGIHFDDTNAIVQAGFGTLGAHGAIYANSWIFQQNLTDWSYSL